MKFFDLNKSLNERGFLSGFVELPKDRAHWSVTLFLIVLAYLLSFWIRLEWIDFAQASYITENGEVQYLRSDMVKNGVALPNTHDSFYFGSILQKAHMGMHENNHLIPSVYKNGMITFLPYLLLKFFPSLDIELLLLWLPVFVSGLVCLPIVLIGRLYGSSLWGFFAACLAGITHSYYNRTLAGYYDTDMFSITIPAFALYFLIASSRKESIVFLLFGILTLYLGRFFYGSIQAITCSMALSFLVFRWGVTLLDFLSLLRKSSNLQNVNFQNLRSFDFACITTFYIGWFLYVESWSKGFAVELYPVRFCIGFIVPIAFHFFVQFLLKPKLASSDLDSLGPSIQRFSFDPSKLMGNRIIKSTSVILVFFFVLGITPFINFGPFSGTWSKITGKLESYSVIAGESKKSNSSFSANYHLNFKDVKTTIREASEIPPDVVRNRILADAPSCSCPRCLPANKKSEAWILPTAVLGFFGLGLLILRYWELCLTIPFLAIAYYCFKGAVGLRFTVHVGNAASIGLVFMVLIISWAILRVFFSSRINSPRSYDLVKWCSWGLSGIIVCFFAMPNIQHAKNYNSHVVYPIKTIEVLKKMNEVSKPDDFVVTWWDYGSGCWFYGNTRTFTSPAHQTNDNFLTSEILRSTSASRAANLARLKTETFVNLQEQNLEGNSTYSTAVQAIFKDGTPQLKFYQGLINDISDDNFTLPKKSRDVFLFLPYEILRIFPTILSFSSRNLYLPHNNVMNDSGSKEPPMMILKNGRREGSSLVFDGGYRLDRRGFLRFKGDKSGIIPYGEILEVSEDGAQSQKVDSILWGGLEIPSNVDPIAARRILFVRADRELVILSPQAFRSTFARRFLLDQFDQKAYRHNLFNQGPFPPKQPFMAQADWVTQSGPTLQLNMRGGYKIDVNLNDNLAKIPGIKENVPFNFYRFENQTNGKMVRLPPKKTPNAKFHLIQTNLPVFLGGRTYEIPQGGKSLKDVAQINNLVPKVLSVSLGLDIQHHFEEFDKIEIPAKGYELRPAFFFMDAEVFSSTLIQGFLMENLDNKYFEKVYASPWGKVYKILK